MPRRVVAAVRCRAPGAAAGAPHQRWSGMAALGGSGDRSFGVLVPVVCVDVSFGQAEKADAGGGGGPVVAGGQEGAIWWVHFVVGLDFMIARCACAAFVAVVRPGRRATVFAGVARVQPRLHERVADGLSVVVLHGNAVGALVVDGTSGQYLLLCRRQPYRF